jgi:4-carboxymuconolactone decarboxylase
MTHGRDMYRRIFGNDPSPEPARGLRELSLDHLFAEVWTREGLSIRDRRLVTLALLAAQGRPDQLRAHLRGVAHYAGWAAGTSGQALAKEVFAEAGSGTHS